MKVISENYVLDVDNKTIKFKNKHVSLYNFFNDTSVDTDTKLNIAKEITFELRLRGFNGYDIYSYITDLWSEYETFKR